MTTSLSSSSSLFPLSLSSSSSLSSKVQTGGSKVNRYSIRPVETVEPYEQIKPWFNTDGNIVYERPYEN